MTPARRARLKKRLLELRDELLAQDAVPIAPTRTDDTRVGGDEDEQPLIEMSQAIASRRNKERKSELERIDRALARLAAAPDEFGLCRTCEEEIAPKRLDLRPYVELCVDCQAKRDGPKGPPGRKHLTDFRD